MTDFVIEKKLADPRTTLWDQVAAADRVRISQGLWRDLLPDRADASTHDGQQVEFDSLEDLQGWLDRREASTVKTIFVRWTVEGRSAGPGMARIALRLGEGATMWVGGTDEAVVQGMSQLLINVLGERSDSSIVRSVRRPKPVKQSVNSAQNERAILRQATDPQGTPSQPNSESTKKSLRGINHPWVVAIGSTVVGGVILLWIASAFFR